MIHTVLSLCLAATAQPATAPAQNCRVVVLDLDGSALPEVERGVTPLITESLVQEVDRSSGCKVMAEADVRKLIDLEADKQSCGGGADACVAEIGAAIGAERVVAGSIGKLGAKYVVQARLLDAQRVEVLQRAEQVVPGGQEQLRSAAQNVARLLFGKQPLPANPDLQVATADSAEGQDRTAGEDGEDASSGSALLWAGAGLAAVGIGLGAAGGITAGVTEAQLGDPNNQDKETALLGGRLGLGVAGVGTLLVAAGAVLAGVALVGG